MSAHLLELLIVPGRAWLLSVFVALVLHRFGGDPGNVICRLFVRLHQELWLSAPVGLFALVYEDWAQRNWFGMFFSLFNFALWWALRNWPDDNIWKRRGKRALDKVRAVAGRLVVSPA
jgi:hypothetical protein